jgi:hypothetical protein
MSWQLEHDGSCHDIAAASLRGSTGWTPRLEGGCHAGREDGQDSERPSRQPPPPRLF